jgi:hypothetical protein
MKSLLKDGWVELDKFIKGTLHAMYFENSLHTWPEIITPEDKYDHSTDSRYLLTPYTIGYWTAFYNRYQILEDKAMVNHWKSEYSITHPKFDWTIWHRQIHEINVRYGLDKDHWQNIPDAFAEYNELFKEYFKRDLSIAVYPVSDTPPGDYDFGVAEFDPELLPDESDVDYNELLDGRDDPHKDNFYDLADRIVVKKQGRIIRDS